MDFMSLRSLKGIKLDIGCGGNKQPNFFGMDKRELDGVDIVWDIEKFPWPLNDNSCVILIASHFVEHLDPKLMIDFMNEAWRVAEIGASFAIAVPYAGSRGYWQDPTHCNGCNEVTWTYFDPTYPLYGIYKPKPWRIRKGFPVYQVQGNMEVILEKVSEDFAGLQSTSADNTLGISIGDSVNTDEKIGG